MNRPSRLYRIKLRQFGMRAIQRDSRHTAANLAVGPAARGCDKELSALELACYVSFELLDFLEIRGVGVRIVQVLSGTLPLYIC